MSTCRPEPAAAPSYNPGTVMPARDFKRFSEYIYDQCGLNLSTVKRTMLTLRLLKRMRILGMSSFSQYYEFVISPEGQAEELVHMIDVVTTNKTDFFREPKHFDFLTNKALPELMQNKPAGGPRNLNIWSAGCSSGEEPYTLAMVLGEYFNKDAAGGFSILATDISTRVLEIGRQGIYPGDAVEPIPFGLKTKYLMKGKDFRKGLFRIVPELRSRVHFQRLNLLEGDGFGISAPMDIIFCRNVIIYFDRQTQGRLFGKFYDQLIPGGYMFIGHSETLHGVYDRFRPVSVSVYRKPECNTQPGKAGNEN